MKKIKYDTNKLIDIRNSLLAEYGSGDWWPASTPFEVMCGAILTQNTVWQNVEAAFDNLGRDKTPRQILDLPMAELADAIRPSGYFNQKAKRIKALAQWYIDGGGEVSAFDGIEKTRLREMLLSVNGVGFETADSILLYAFHRPVFVVDAYTRRLFDRLGFDIPRSYEDFAACFHEALEPNTEMYAQYHGLIVEHSKVRCFKKSPDCESCPLSTFCAFAIDNRTKIV